MLFNKASFSESYFKSPATIAVIDKNANKINFQKTIVSCLIELIMFYYNPDITCHNFSKLWQLIEWGCKENY